MKKKILVTTALKSTWDLENDMIFLGNWCEKYDNFENLDQKRYAISDYYWDDRSKLVEDYQYINRLYVKIFDQLKINLNEFHKVNLGNRFWKIVIGPWLITFLQILFELLKSNFYP